MWEDAPVLFVFPIGDFFNDVSIYSHVGIRMHVVKTKATKVFDSKTSYDKQNG